MTKNRHYEFILTCNACPEQYDVWDNEKNINVGYVRYRYGYLQVHPYFPEVYQVKEWRENKPSNKQNVDWETIIYEWDSNDQWDGVLDDDIRDNMLDNIDEKIWEYWQSKNKTNYESN